MSRASKLAAVVRALTDPQVIDALKTVAGAIQDACTTEREPAREVAATGRVIPGTRRHYVDDLGDNAKTFVRSGVRARTARS